jgi:hypothetical protein
MDTPIMEIVGVGPKTADTLSEYGYHYAEELAIAAEEDLLKITGFGPSRAKKVIEMARELLLAISNEPETPKSLSPSLTVDKKDNKLSQNAKKKKGKKSKKTKDSSNKKKKFCKKKSSKLKDVKQDKKKKKDKKKK